jgi:hypothetical protein
MGFTYHVHIDAYLTHLYHGLQIDNFTVRCKSKQTHSFGVSFKLQSHYALFCVIVDDCHRSK